MNQIWRANRWYDRLETTAPTSRFLYAMAMVLVLLSVPIVVELVTGYSAPWLTIAPYGMMIPLIAMRYYWLHHASKDIK